MHENVANSLNQCYFSCLYCTYIHAYIFTCLYNIGEYTWIALALQNLKNIKHCSKQLQNSRLRYIFTFDFYFYLYLLFVFATTLLSIHCVYLHKFHAKKKRLIKIKINTKQRQRSTTLPTIELSRAESLPANASARIEALKQWTNKNKQTKIYKIISFDFDFNWLGISIFLAKVTNAQYANDF